MTERDEFLRSVLPRLIDADTAMHNGDPLPRISLWSENEPVTLFGAVLSDHGPSEVTSVFRRVAKWFSDCESFDYEVIAADASEGLAYIVGIEHTTARVRGGPPQTYALRVTTIFRREDGEWKAVHRHADPVPDGPPIRDRLSPTGEKPET